MLLLVDISKLSHCLQYHMKADYKETIKQMVTAIVECPVQETPLGKGTLEASKQRITFKVNKLQIVINYDNVISFGVSGNRLIIFIRSDHPVEDEQDEQLDFNIDEVNQIRESLQKGIQHKVNLVGPYKFFLDFEAKQTMKGVYEKLTQMEKQHQADHKESISPVNLHNFEIEGVGNILSEMQEQNLDILQELDD